MNEATKVGRKRKEVPAEIFQEALRRFRAGELTMDEAAGSCGIGRAAFWRRIKEAEGTKPSLGDVLKAGVSESDTGKDELRLIPISDIDPDPKNFYSLEGIEALAWNIELVGLQQPLLVREEDGRYVIISGHRRREAILQILADGSDQFAGGVPCIVERSPDSPEMRELKLIYANAATRVMTSAEISLQAERVQDLLYRLKAQGVEFPGRMREHVAEACRISASKLARLQAIRAKLDAGLLITFDRGEMPEETAYQLSRLPAEIQHAVDEELRTGRRKKMPTASVVEAVNRKLDELSQPLSCRAHAGGPECHHTQARIVRSIFEQYSYNVYVCSDGRCCMDCSNRHSCKAACQEARDRVKLDKAVEKEKAEKAEKEREAGFALRRKQVVKISRELLPLIEKAGLKDDEDIYTGYDPATAGDVRKWAAGETGDAKFYSLSNVRPDDADEIRSMCAKLGITAGQALGTEPITVSESDTGGAADGAMDLPWRSGTPKTPGAYVCWATYHTYEPDFEILFWQDGRWQDSPVSSHESESRVLAWFPLTVPALYTRGEKNDG